MFYVRFLSVPKVRSPSNHRHRVIKFVVALTTDLGDDFYASEMRLRATAVDEAGETVATRIYVWPPKARAVPTELRFEHPGPSTPLRIWVTALDSSATARLDQASLPALVGVGSAPLTWANGVADARVERCFGLGGVPELRLWEETGDSIARHVWDGGIALVAYLTLLVSSDQSSALGKALRDCLRPNPERVRAIELGAGCGMVGIAIAQLFPNVEMLLTDLPDAMDLLTDNVRCAGLAQGSTADAMVLDWEEELPAPVVQRNFDLIVVSECTYNSDSIPALARVVASLIARSAAALVLLSTKVRHESEAAFFDRFAEAGLVRVDKTALALPPSPGAWRMSDQVDIYLFRATTSPRSIDDACV